VWVLRISAILFLASAVIGMVGKPRTGLLAGIAGAVATIGLTVVTAWSIIDPERDIAVNHLIMILCILWNAYSAFTAIRSALR
jgi:predicted amino acid-binding ACT domain protein